ncbi:MAG: hypothetical protein Q7S14_02820, partial [bacterium]|nr:hypothetical protein [bacterium]
MKKKGAIDLIALGIFIALTVLIPATVKLVQQRQETRTKAEWDCSGPTTSECMNNGGSINDCCSPNFVDSDTCNDPLCGTPPNCYQCESPPQPQSPPPCQCWDGECNGDGTCTNPLPQPPVTWQEECKVGGGSADDRSSCGNGTGYCINGVCIKDNSSPTTNMEAYIKCLNEGNQPEDCERQSRETQPPVTPTQTTSQGGSAAVGSVCQSVGQITSEDYHAECDEGKGAQICHKYGVCAGVGGGVMLSWINGVSQCGACVLANPTTPIITIKPADPEIMAKVVEEQTRIKNQTAGITNFCGIDPICTTRLNAELAAKNNVDIASLTNLKDVFCGQNKDCYDKNIGMVVLSGWYVTKEGDMYLPKDIVHLLNPDGQIYNGNYF